MALTLNDGVTGKRSQGESADIMAGADDSMYIAAGEQLDGVAQKLEIVAFVVNTTGTIANLIANDTDSTDVAGAGLTKGNKNLVGDLAAGTYIQAGKYEKGRSWKSLTTGTATVIAYYNYQIDRNK